MLVAAHDSGRLQFLPLSQLASDSAQAMTDLIAGQIDYFNPLAAAAAISMINCRRVRSPGA
jgi:hypothetical protein